MLRETQPNDKRITAEEGPAVVAIIFLQFKVILGPQVADAMTALAGAGRASTQADRTVRRGLAEKAWPRKYTSDAGQTPLHCAAQCQIASTDLKVRERCNCIGEAAALCVELRGTPPYRETPRDSCRVIPPLRAGELFIREPRPGEEAGASGPALPPPPPRLIMGSERLAAPKAAVLARLASAGGNEKATHQLARPARYL